MKKILSIIFAISLSLSMFALDPSTLDPGIYFKAGDDYVKVNPTFLKSGGAGAQVGAFSISKEKHKIKGVTSDVKTTSNPTFVLVFATKKVKKLDKHFAGNIKPEYFSLFDLEVKKNDRLVHTNPRIMGIKAPDGVGKTLQFKEIGEKIFEVTLENLEVGEYAFFYSPVKSESGKAVMSVLGADYVDWTTSYCFSVEE